MTALGITATARRRIGDTAFYSTSTVLAVLFISPLAWSFFTSVYGSRATGGEPGFGGDNYARLVDYGAGLWQYSWNSIVVSFVAVAGTLLVSVLGGYAFARFRFPGKNLIFLGALAILMIPHPTILVPLYTMLGWVGMQNSLISVGLVLVMFQLPFGLFMMRNAFEALPKEIEEAALLDGCSSFGALRRILLRAVVPAMVTVGMFAFLAAWNEFLTPLIFLTQGESFTLPVALVSLRSGEMGAIDLGALQAGIVVTAIPCLLIFILLQRHYVRGFAAGAVRG
ncbi:carbohydrate ABC transporter permease [Microbacterium sp. 18062]|uniref:carbohydrate ABC transporter permease n=1 Tax=Microbacterium sp. 18062 TaxID=2681410 RepID=UPI001F1913EE|nr:carbohydrate ABC transporter permease [Microbacterium sp. 18062]